MAGGSRFFGVLGSPIYNRVVWRQPEKVASQMAALDLQLVYCCVLYLLDVLRHGGPSEQ